MTIASSVASTPASSDARAPYTTRENTSRPRSSVPMMCALDGPCRTALKFVAAGSYGAMSGAKIAMRTNNVATQMPATASGRRPRRRSARRRVRTRGATATSIALIASAPAGSRRRRRSRNDALSCLTSGDADARVEDRIQEVHREVDDDVADRRDQDDALDDRVVAREDGVERELAEAGQDEDLLGHHRAGDQQAELEAEDRHDRQEAVAQRVAADDLALAEPLRPCGADVVRIQRLEHRGARLAEDHRREARAEHDRRQ